MNYISNILKGFGQQTVLGFVYQQGFFLTENSYLRMYSTIFGFERN